jgi:hypothetical protein
MEMASQILSSLPTKRRERESLRRNWQEMKEESCFVEKCTKDFI